MIRVIFTLLTIIWMLIIFMFSNQKSVTSTENSQSLIRNTIVNIYKLFDKDASQEKLDEIVQTFDVPVRKLCHFTEYFILGILVLLMLKSYNINNIYLTILICFVYSCTDEFHQLFVPGRSGNIIDIIIDTSGSIFFTILYNLVCKRKK